MTIVSPAKMKLIEITGNAYFPIVTMADSVENICMSFSGNIKNIPVATAIILTENIKDHFKSSLFLRLLPAP